MRRDIDTNTHGAWNIDAKSEPHSVDNDSLGVRGLKIEGMIDDAEVVARVVTVDARSDEDTSSERQAYMLRRIGMRALLDDLQLNEASFDDVSLVLSELISNAQRHSASGPLQVALVRVSGVESEERDLVSVTVVNGSKPKQIEFPDDEFLSGDEAIDGLSVHGRGKTIVEQYAYRNGRFEFDKKQKIGVYALLLCERDRYDQVI